MKQLLEEYKVNGMKSLVEALLALLRPSSQQRILREMDMAGRYSHEPMTLDASVSDVVMKRRGSSAFRLSLAITEARKAGALKSLYSVYHNDAKTEDVVVIFGNGALACSCGDFMSKGYPCRHYCALVIAGLTCWSPLRHLHPSFLPKNYHLIPYDNYLVIKVSLLLVL